MDILALVAQALPKYIAFLFALCFHEMAHAWVAKLRGDQTAKMMGRLTMNPIPHADFIGTVLLPILAFIQPAGFLIGWAKPVPVNPRNLTRPKIDLFWIAFAGPLSNIVLALIGTIALKIAIPLFYQQPIEKFVFEFLPFFIQINLFLFIFNLIPIHPLDGGKVVARFLPDSVNQKLEDNQMILSVILLLGILSGALSFWFQPAIWIYNILIGFALL